MLSSAPIIHCRSRNGKSGDCNDSRAGSDKDIWRGSGPRPCSFDFADAKFFGVIGHNGAGKTTLLKFSPAYSPTSGELTINGIDVISDPDAIKPILGYLPEESRLYETMTADDYLSFFGEIYGLGRETIKSRQQERWNHSRLTRGRRRSANSQRE